MKRLFNTFFKFLHDIKGNIAFYPTIISVVGFGFAFVMMYLESLGASEYLVEKAPSLVVNNSDTARSLLTTFIAGLISIMVFSFSLVMILLNRATNNFSPRLLPGLISNTRHQVILGIYNGTLLYCIFTLVAIVPEEGSKQIPGFSVLLGIILMTFSLGAFIYFIHSISQEIQVNTMMSKVYKTSKKRMESLIKDEEENQTDFEDTSNWETILADGTGYLQDVNLKSLGQLVEDKELMLEIVPVKGAYVLSGIPVIKYKGDVDDALKNEILDTIHFANDELIEDNYVLAFKQITEIAVKAMSPGINDPGTAINAIDYLTELFAIRMRKKDKTYHLNKNGKALISIKTVDFDELLYNVMAALRTYCKHDVIIVQKLLIMFRYLLHKQEFLKDEYKKAIISEIVNLKKDALSEIHNTADKKVVSDYCDFLERHNPTNYEFND